MEIGIRKVKRNHVYLDRNKIEFVSYKERENKFNKLDKQEKSKYLKFENWYLKQLAKLTDIVEKRGSTPIFVTQTTGYGHSYESFIVARTIIKHCNIKKLTCVNLAKELDLNYEDFYDESHLNIVGSKKFSDYIYKKLPIF